MKHDERVDVHAGRPSHGRTSCGTRRLSRAFTLIELLLVLVILAALAAIAVPKMIGRAEQGRVTSAITQIHNFKVALDTFRIDCRRYPTTEEGLRALVEQPGNVTGWNSEGYIENIPPDPWGNPYIYRCPGQHNPNGFDVYSFGPDGQDGGADDIGNWTTK
jgi:general secretion pathway protein G